MTAEGPLDMHKPPVGDLCHLCLNGKTQNRLGWQRLGLSAWASALVEARGIFFTKDHPQ